MTVQVGDVVARKEHIVGAEMYRPVTASEPGMFHVGSRCPFAGDEKIDDSDGSSGTQDALRVVESCKPIGNHGERVRKRDDICITFRGRERGCVRFDRLDVRPAVFLNAFSRNLKERGREVDDVDFLHMGN